MENNKPVRILVVDDELYLRELVARHLAAEGYECVTAPSGEEALRTLESSDFNLVVTDIMMPGMSGMDLLRMVKPLYPDVAVIMATSVKDHNIKSLAVGFGAYGFVTKPFDRNQLLKSVAGALERRRMTVLGPDQWNVV